ncbi:hypothetical protein [Deinococcus aquatilis]|jgi:hypothetical protein|uniref:hypothetical protein n=1 Tax=Deinococcus aquatilis TaxID=519440 RepID=UPI0003756C1D|nr:hypothetical protein [Deinococcus aquatilis]
MISRRIWLTAFLLLGLLRLAALGFSAFSPVVDLQVLNRSGAAVTGVRVCLKPGNCVQQPELKPNRTWWVPLKITDDGGAVLTFDQQAASQRSSTYITRGMGVHWLILPGGRIQQKQ